MNSESRILEETTHRMHLRYVYLHWVCMYEQRQTDLQHQTWISLSLTDGMGEMVTHSQQNMLKWSLKKMGNCFIQPQIFMLIFVARFCWSWNVAIGGFSPGWVSFGAPDCRLCQAGEYRPHNREWIKNQELIGGSTLYVFMCVPVRVKKINSLHDFPLNFIHFPKLHPFPEWIYREIFWGYT